MYTILPYQSNPALRQIAREIPLDEIESPRIQELIAEMKALLAQEEYGVALAAPQVGEALRLFIVSGAALVERDSEGRPLDTAGTDTPPDMVYINPVILKTSKGRKDKHEGCLSVKGKWGYVPRADKVTIRAYDEHGRLVTRGASGLLAHIFQHEMDHLEGVLYIDKAGTLYDDEPGPESRRA